MLRRPSSWRRLTGRASRLPLLLLIALAAAGCRKEAGALSRPAPLVAVAEANLGDVPVYIDEIGAYTGSEVVSIRPQASGQILQRHFVDGADLKKDDLLFTIDPRPYQAALDQAQAALAQGQAAVSLAKSEFDRAETLLPTKAISKEDYETRKSALEVAQAQSLQPISDPRDHDLVGIFREIGGYVDSDGKKPVRAATDEDPHPADRVFSQQGGKRQAGRWIRGKLPFPLRYSDERVVHVMMEKDLSPQIDARHR